MVMMRPRGGSGLHAPCMPIAPVLRAAAPAAAPAAVRPSATKALPARELPGKRNLSVSCAH